ncbi:16S rRNA (cytosine(967)-C(5))-methyltransferase RsmB [Nitrosomonas sp.]|uniref:16S rRNA (cytosine(967)-C(5))-methyltransferase RsmB n=1 Tax=Nitrosomonas sp. TaxID=42353 RepID=UPI0026014EFF|nr:16S rRNA (cytosine(967)-C(5))-methyltransferase RsmB [Nitrosomonas sp.]MCC6916410.1 16S rRNA (cytosine(967)-C(5))-methyltransferase RsmB [Nitrosomonas sp.]
MIEIQLLAVQAIGEVFAGASLNEVLRHIWQTGPHLTSQQRGAIQDIAYGVLRHYGQFDALLRRLLNKPLQDKQLHYLLTIALYQLCYSKAPAHAIVDHAVSSSRKISHNPAISGLINAVLRNFMRKQTALTNEIREDEVARYSYPQWWINKLRQQYPQDYKAILLAGNEHPAMILRINPLRTSIHHYQVMLKTQDIDSEWLWGNALRLRKPVPVERLPGFHEGLITVQDAGAQFAAPLLDVSSGMRVLDACAAPGGKSTHLAELSEGIELTVLDKYADRLTRLTENFSRLKITGYHLVCGDAMHPSQWWDGRLYDRILADVPCSASGVVSRHPDIKWLRRPGDIRNFAQAQMAILNALWPLLRQGGKLLYATCSIFNEENNAIAEKFLTARHDASRLPVSREAMNNGQLLPGSQHDGFFYALFQKD